MIIASRTQFHVERPWGQCQCPFSIVSFVLNVKALVGAFNQEKALVGAFSVITNLRMELFEALVPAPGARLLVAVGGNQFVKI